MKNVISDKRKAGFWIRFAATWVDLFIVWIVIKTVIAIFNHAGGYVPFELTFGLSFLVYSALFIGWRGCTVGKAICGLAVQTSNGKPVGYIRALLRETVCKLISAVFLFLGFIWAGFSRRKRGWHDYIVGTIVLQRNQKGKRFFVTFGFVFVLTVFFIAREPINNIWTVCLAVRRMAVPSDVRMLYENRDSSSLLEISSLSKQDHTKFIEWLDENAKDPLEYAIETASKHQVTIFGEIHEQKDYLLFLNKIIPELYHRAGVTCVAMEVCLAEDNEKIDQLVTGPTFDHKLALDIARHQFWGIWGFKEYWDVFETVWRLNSQIPDGRKKMRLIGIDVKCDGPSLGLVTGGEGAKIKSPIWEKLRVFRLFDDILLLVKRDELMARNIEKEIIERGERAIVWIGLNHSYTHYRQPIIMNEKLVREFNRMGMILYRKYGDQIFQVALHEGYFDSIMKEFIEPVMKERVNVPVGFDVFDSPFMNLRDNNSKDYHYYSGLRFCDKARGYIYLKPVKKLKKCGWLDGYISEKMFVANKPYYKAWAHLAEREVNNAKEVNEVFRFIFEN